jgi:hypothetical protein
MTSEQKRIIRRNNTVTDKRTGKSMVFLPLLYGAITATFTAVMVPAIASAQQTSARGMSGNMNLARLEQRLRILETDNAHMLTCQQQGMLYLPSCKNSDSNGCIATGKVCGVTGNVTGADCSANSKTIFVSWTTPFHYTVYGRCPAAAASKVVSCTSNQYNLMLAQCLDGSFTPIMYANFATLSEPCSGGGCSNGPGGPP